MSFHLIPLAWRTPLPAMDKLILIKLCDCANDDGSSCRPSVGAIERDCGVSRRKVHFTLRDFQERGLLEVVVPGGGRNRATEYRIRVDRLKQLGEEERTRCTVSDKGAGQADTRNSAPGAPGAPHAPSESDSPGESDDQKGCTRFTLPLKTPYKKKTRKRDLIDQLVDDALFRSAWALHYPELKGDDALRSELDMWRLYQPAKVEQGSAEVLVRVFTAWLQNPTTRRRLKGQRRLKTTRRRTADEAIRPTFGPGIGADDRELVTDACRLWEASRPGVWAAWGGSLTFAALDGSELEVQASPLAADVLKNHLDQLLEQALARVARRRIEVRVVAIDQAGEARA